MKQGRRIGVAVFGYSRRRVRQLLQEREALAQEAEARLRAAEGRILGLHHELEVVEKGLSERDSLIQELGAQVEAFARSPDAPTPKVLVRELDSILTSAQATAEAMIERTRAVTERKLQDASEYERRLYADLVRADEWRQEALPLIRAVHSRIGEIRARLEEVAESVIETVKPLEQLSDIDWPQAEQLALLVSDRFGQQGDRDGNGHRPQSHESGDRSAQGDGESDLIDLQRRARAR
ncbi:MAG TPA: hypothetical protein VEQ37_10955 [Actinomycetota bacterium]|nr:hypothetical protein [Actinomycetota bacterium]